MFFASLCTGQEAFENSRVGSDRGSGEEVLKKLTGRVGSGLAGPFGPTRGF